MKKNRLFLILTLILLLCGGCYTYDYPLYDLDYSSYYQQERRQQQVRREHRELNRKLDNINSELEWQAFDDRWDRLNRELGY